MTRSIVQAQPVLPPHEEQPSSFDLTQQTVALDHSEQAGDEDFRRFYAEGVACGAYDTPEAVVVKRIRALKKRADAD
jgi:hypothetical protein